MGPDTAKFYTVPSLITLVFALLTAINLPAVDEYVEALLVDYRFKVRSWIAPPGVPDDVVIVAIDEKSLAARGRWPWGRKLQAELLERVLASGPRVVGVDIFYPEAESPAADQALASTFAVNRKRLVVALGCEVENARAFDGEVEEPVYDLAVTKIRDIRRLRPIVTWHLLLPPAAIADAATFGHVYSLPDRDGKLRWEVLYLQYGEEYLPSFALQVARIAMGVPVAKVAIDGNAGVTVGHLFIPTDHHGRLHINYLGKEGAFPTVSADDVLSGRVRPETFRDKLVLVGTTALATYDQKVTPFSANMTGVEKNATVVANILREGFIVRPSVWVDIAVVWVVGVGTAILLRGRRAWASFLMLVGLLGCLLAGNQAAFSLAGLRLNLTYPLFAVLANGTYVVGRRYLQQERLAWRIRRLFERYVAPEVVKILLERPEYADVGGQHREVTVLIADVRGFAAFSEHRTPEEVVAHLNRYLEEIVDVVFHWRGTLDKFVGDAVVVYWGAPLPQPDHAELAVRCALHLRQTLGQLSAAREREGQPVFEVGVGINTGEVVVGNIGATERKMDYTVIGDPVNVAARVEALTRRYDAHVLLTRDTVDQIRTSIANGHIGHVEVCGLAAVAVKGREQAVEVYRLMARADGEGSQVTDCGGGQSG